MSKLRVLSFAVSIDGYSAGPNQDLQNPLKSGRSQQKALSVCAAGISKASKPAYPESFG